MSVPTLPLSSSLPAGRSSSAFNELRSCSGSRKARVLYDYDAAGSSELSLLADEVGDGRVTTQQIDARGGAYRGPLGLP